ncbi:MAG: hypothetical protein ACJAQ6_000145 [Arenicella sp.]|jgi:hypothetical protein
MTNTMNSISKLALLLIVSFSISACGGNKKAASQSTVIDTGDITRPPVVEKDINTADTTSPEGETVSFDEWRKRREAERKKRENEP